MAKKKYLNRKTATMKRKLKHQLTNALIVVLIAFGYYVWNHVINKPKVQEPATGQMTTTPKAAQDENLPTTKDSVQVNTSGNVETVDLVNIPEFDGQTPYVAINGNVPVFTEQEKSSTESFENYSPLDELGRVGVGFANLSLDTMPADGEERGSISSVKPSGWGTYKFNIVNGRYLYNRSHLIGWQLSAENANELNLATGTRFFNVDGMLPFENMVADYIRATGNHVLYRVTPVFQDNEMVMRGLQMEAYSVEDNGQGISYNVYVYNAQPGIYIDYMTGTAVTE